MKANELRIGNYYLDFDDEIQQIEMIQPFMFGFKYRWEWEKYIKPIPLTEEILLKCGFEWSIQHQAHKHKKFKYVIDFYNSHPQFNSSVCFLNKEHRSGENLICIQYLHQLQNLYFALTNEELTVNL